MSEMRTIIVYHQVKPGIDCPDGIMAAYIAKRQYPEALLLGWQYDNPNPLPIEPGDTVVLVDFSVPKEVIEAWVTQGCDVTVIDHHKSAWDRLQGLTAGILRFDMSKCGAIGTWQYFRPDEPVPSVLEYVNDKDLWRWELPMSEEVNEAIANLRFKLKPFGYDIMFAALDPLMAMSQIELIDTLADIGAKELEPQRKLIRDLAESAVRHDTPNGSYMTIDFDTLKDRPEFADQNIGRQVSKLGTYLYNKYSDIAFVGMVSTNANGMRQWELRSDDARFHVRPIAEFFGGGGHDGAAGFSLLPNRVVAFEEALAALQQIPAFPLRDD